MIRNIVFDLGRVLVDFDPAAYLRGFAFDEETAGAVQTIVFGGEAWRRHDRGDYESIAALQTELMQAHPAYAAEIRQVLQPDWVKMHTLRQEMETYLLALKQRGYRIYILSNLAEESHRYIARYPFFAAIDGGVYSYQERVCKPDARIYRVLLERYSLQPEETVFLDDSAENIAAAKKLGMHGIVVADSLSAKSALETLLNDAG